jgi:hypothetical protein
MSEIYIVESANLPIDADRMKEGKSMDEDGEAVTPKAIIVPSNLGMDKPVGKRRENCVLCRHPQRKSLEEKIAKGELTKKIVAEDLECSVDAVYDHMMNHFTTSPLMTVNDKPKKLRELYDKKDVLMTSFIQLKERLDAFMANDRFEPSDTSQIIKMTEEIRKLAETLSSLEGELKTESTYTLNMYIDLRNVVLGMLCPECRAKVIEELSRTERAMQTIDLSKVVQ